MIGHPPLWSPLLARLIGMPWACRTWVGVFAVGMALCHGRAVAASSNHEGRPDPASRVQALFAAKCVECHGADLRRPRGKFGYVLDLGRVASNPKMVVPFQPDESKLWKLVRDDEMPPEGARSGAMTEEEKETVRAWIKGGALPAPPAQLPRAAEAAAPASPNPATESLSVMLPQRTLRLLGKLHVLVVHFPIALLVAAAAGEAWSVWYRHRSPAPEVRFCVLFGAAGAVLAAALGWLNAAYSGVGAGSEHALALHRWLGTAAGVWAVILALVSEREVYGGVRSWRFRIILFIGALLVGVAAHLGGTLVYGEDYFNW